LHSIRSSPSQHGRLGILLAEKRPTTCCFPSERVSRNNAIALAANDDARKWRCAILLGLIAATAPMH